MSTVANGTRVTRLPEFRLLWGSQSLSMLGTSVSRTALPLIAVTTLAVSPLQMGLLQAALGLSYLVLGLPAGAWIDRMRRRPVLIVCDLSRAVLMVTLACAALLGHLTFPVLLLVALLLGAARTFYEIAYQAYIPAVVGRDRLVEGNSKLESTNSASQMAGPAAAGALAQVGAAAAVSAQAVSYLASFLLLLRIRKPEAEPPRKPTAHLCDEIKNGLSFVLKNPLIRAVVGSAATFNFFYAVQAPLILLLLIHHVGLSGAAAGAFMTVGGVGGVLGAIWAGTLAGRLGQVRIIWLAYLTTIPMVLLIPLAGPGWRMLFFVVPWFAAAFGLVVYNVAQVSFRQAMCPDHLLGRMNASVRFLIWGIIPVGGVVGGVLGEWLGVRGALLIAGTGMTSGALWLICSRLRRVRDIPLVRHEAEAPVAGHASEESQKLSDTG
ncbi:MFS transporter [Streptomyces durbertensis]|uniref:MFS transporter n=1 Tax=Streptomyces durbertensis TaxID=2448886 RepID=A0ABR6EI09_9ACTN|nr:MFS transporter [Streptomyces durbertensis]MBB1244968.1 MFS transporter [Streptomyces durbertensis]